MARPPWRKASARIASFDRHPICPTRPVRYWRDKSGHEVDFVIARHRDEVDAVECKWDPRAFDRAGLEVFRRYYPNGRNYLVTPSGEMPYTKSFGPLDVRVCTLAELHS